MKKSVIIVIALIYVTAIALVSFIGLTPKVNNQTVYIESIKITSDREIKKIQGDDTIHFINEFKADGTRTVQLNCEVVPDDATNKKVNFTLEKENTYATVDENGLITITTPGTHVFPVFITADDNTSISYKIIISAVDTSDFE